MIPFGTMTAAQSQKISINPQIVQFLRAADNADDECLIVLGKISYCR